MTPHRDDLAGWPRFLIERQSRTQAAERGAVVPSSEVQEAEVVQHQRLVHVVIVSAIQRQRLVVPRLGVGVLARQQVHVRQIHEIGSGWLIAAGSAVQRQGIGKGETGRIPVAQFLRDQANIVLISRRSTVISRSFAQLSRLRQELASTAQIAAIHSNRSQGADGIAQGAVITNSLGELSASLEVILSAVGGVRLVESGADVAECRRRPRRIRELLVAREALAPIQERRLNPDATQGVVASAPETVSSHFGASLARGTGSKPRDLSQQKGVAPRQRVGLD